MTETPGTLAAALAALQTKLPTIKKSERAIVETKAGGSYSYTYADLANISEQVLPLLGELGLSFIAKPTFVEGRFVLAYSLLHTSGQREDGEYPLPSSGTPQAIGSAITYGRRYCLTAVTGVAPEEDDDAASAEAEAQGHRGTAQRATRQRSQPPTSGHGTTTQRARPPAAGQPPLPTDSDGITPDQQRKLHAALRDANLADREAGLGYISGLLKREVTSTKDLSKRDAAAVIDTLEPEPEGPQ